MTWREFSLRHQSYRRKQKESWEHTRILSHMIYLSIPEKGNKKTIDQFWPLNENNNAGLKEYQKQMLIEAQKQAIQEAKQKQLKNG